MIELSWIAVDWGTTNLRAFAVSSTNKILAEAKSKDGMSSLGPHEFEGALLKLVEPWLNNRTDIPVYTCGMVGAKQGWKETAYCPVPCAPVSDVKPVRVNTVDNRLRVHILPGLSQSEPADVMRGEETQIAGLISKHPNYTGTVCLPGTHSKWVKVVDGHVTGFQTFMTGEIFDLISSKSVLRHSLSTRDENFEDFVHAARKAMHDPGGVMRELFGIRARSLVVSDSVGSEKAHLSGMIIGQELGLTWRYWENTAVDIIGSANVAELYEVALSSLGVDVSMHDSSAATLEGLRIAANAA